MSPLYPRSAAGERYTLATPHPLATEAGESMFRAGGTAADAAVAAAAVLAVVAPHECGVGGDAFALSARPDGRVAAINGSGAAPRGLDAGAVMGLTGPRTITVPGAVGAWEALSARDGRLGFATALEPAIACARDGVAVSASLAAALYELAAELRDPGLRSVLFGRRRRTRAGDRLVQPALARSLEALAGGGAAALYGGAVGDALATGLRRLGSPLSATDLALHSTEVGPPLQRRFHELDVLTAPPNSQGFVLLEILLALAAAGPGVDALADDAPLLAALFQLAARDAERHLADPRRVGVPVDELLSPARTEVMLARGRARSLAGPPAIGSVPGAASGDTVAVVAADAAGHTVSLIQSLFRAFGSGVLEPETGILCHNRGSAFSPDPASPNAPAGGKRPAHTLMPVLVRRPDGTVAALGALGGTMQPQVLAAIILRLSDPAESPLRAVAAPRWVLSGPDVDSRQDVVLLEHGAGDAVAERFRASGWEPLVLPDHAGGVGEAQVVGWREPGTLQAASDPRSRGAAAAG